jgi:hypothetical protein
MTRIRRIFADISKFEEKIRGNPSNPRHPRSLLK